MRSDRLSYYHDQVPKGQLAASNISHAREQRANAQPGRTHGKVFAGSEQVGHLNGRIAKVRWARWHPSEGNNSVDSTKIKLFKSNHVKRWQITPDTSEHDDQRAHGNSPLTQVTHRKALISTANIKQPREVGTYPKADTTRRSAGSKPQRATGNEKEARCIEQRATIDDQETDGEAQLKHR